MISLHLIKHQTIKATTDKSVVRLQLREVNGTRLHKSEFLKRMEPFRRCIAETELAKKLCREIATPTKDLQMHKWLQENVVGE